MTTTTTFTVHALPPSVLDQVRRTGRDAGGNPVARLVAEGGEPLRCCLRDAAPGEDILLFGYEPPIPPSPYREVGAVFAHAEACPGPEHIDRYPADWLGRRQVLRAYDDRGWIHPATCEHDGSDLPGALSAVLAEPGVVQVHVRNIGYGCIMLVATG